METRLRFYGTHTRVFLDQTQQIDVEGAVRSGKTTLCLAKVKQLCTEYPGIQGLIGRYSDGDTHAILKPAWRELCDRAGLAMTWNSEEGYDELANGSRVYIRGLKAQDQVSRYAKLRGPTLAFIYIDQAEELPQDIYHECVLRLSQPGYPHQMLISPQTVGIDHWIADEFPADRPLRLGRAYYALATRDNAHNLPPNYIEQQEQNHPPGTPFHTTLLLGQRGATIIGDPVYGTPADGSYIGSFVRTRHEGPTPYDSRLALEVGLDFGKSHPCALMRQVSATGQTRYLGGILGHDLTLDPFLVEVLRYVAVWFPSPIETRWCCDPAGMSNPIGVDMSRLLHGHGISARVAEDSNSPLVRFATIQQISARMRARDLAGNEAVRVSNDDAHWIRLSAHGASTHRMVASAFESGYVWDKHLVSVGNKQVRKPLKDGWHEHPMNVVEYLECNFGATPARKRERVVQHAPMARGQMGWAG